MSLHISCWGRHPHTASGFATIAESTILWESEPCTVTLQILYTHKGWPRPGVEGRCAFFRSLECVWDPVPLPSFSRHWRVFYWQPLWEWHVHQRDRKLRVQLQRRLRARTHDELRRQVMLPWGRPVIFLRYAGRVVENYCHLESPCPSSVYTLLHEYIVLYLMQRSLSLSSTLVCWQQHLSGSVIFPFFKIWLHLPHFVAFQCIA